ncbi:hypothetical protein PSBY109024_00045 [Pseudoalteromonas byunsanensis]
MLCGKEPLNYLFNYEALVSQSIEHIFIKDNTASLTKLY